MKKSATKLACLALMGMMTACTVETTEELLPQQPQQQVLRMNMQASVTPFDAAVGTRAEGDWTWDDGATVFIRYYVSSGVVMGHATYSKTEATWEPSFSGELAASGRCEIYYFSTAATSGLTSIALTDSTAVYGNLNGTYAIEDSEISIVATLAPLTSRLRFTGAEGVSVSVDGLKCYTGYDATAGEFKTSTQTVERTVGSDGYTSYVYAVFASDTERQMTLNNSTDGKAATFIKQFAATVLATGESGYLTIPTTSNNRGWTVMRDRVFTVTGNGKTVSFTMKFVNAGTFLMGSDNSDAESDEMPVHQVTLTKSYYMGETEVTQALWYAVMRATGSDTCVWDTKNGLGDDYPAYYISHEECEAFISALNTKLANQLQSGEAFRMPTEAEWEYAARGGSKSQNYIYAGGNSIDDVVWYKVNSYDKGENSHQVKTKAPNELGLYDMSGNVWEWCADWYDANYYSTSPAADPKGPSTGSNYVTRGGGWGNLAPDCRTPNRDYNTPTGWFDGQGLRLALQ